MEAVLKTPFNQSQVEILKLFSQGLTDKQIEELRKVLIAFKLKLLDDHLDRVVQEKGLTIEQINAVSHEHRRTPYKSKIEAARKNQQIQ